MASTLVSPMIQIDKIKEHPNADALELGEVLGYQVVIRKGLYKAGDKAVYVPIDSLMPTDLADRIGVRQFLAGKEKNRVRCAKLRGEPSFGLLIRPGEVGLDETPVGENVAPILGLEKYYPPVRATAGDAAPHDSEIDPFFPRYTDIENGKIHTDIFEEEEEVIATEKLHGCNCRVGYRSRKGFVAGSMGVRRKHPVDENGEPLDLDDKRLGQNTYWSPFTLPGVRSLIQELSKEHEVVILYGEVFGQGIQSMQYGQTGIAFRAFDLCLDGKFQNWDVLESLCSLHGVPVVPVLYRGPYSLEKMAEIAEGNTTIGEVDQIREGIVVKPVVERSHPKIGRVVLKYISNAYKLGKHGEADTTDV